MGHDRRQILQAATTVADERNVTRAAERLGLTQPALSKQLAELEDRVGFVLFERSSQRFAVTAAGAAFVEHARIALRKSRGLSTVAEPLRWAQTTYFASRSRPTSTPTSSQLWARCVCPSTQGYNYDFRVTSRPTLCGYCALGRRTSP